MMTVRPFISRSQSLDHEPLGLGVERRGRLVEDQDRRVADHRPRDADALALAAGERIAALADHRVVAVRHPRDELVGVGELGRGDDLLLGRVGAPIGDVLADRAVEEHRLLQHEADLASAATRACRSLMSLPSISTRPPVGIVEARNQAHDRRFAAAGRPDDPDHLARLDREADVAAAPAPRRRSRRRRARR